MIVATKSWVTLFKVTGHNDHIQLELDQCSGVVNIHKSLRQPLTVTSPMVSEQGCGAISCG